jgi:peptide/nickel transport system substrate-binding protein
MTSSEDLRPPVKLANSPCAGRARRRPAISVGVLAALLCTTAVAGAATRTSSLAQPAKPTLTIGINTAPNSLDPSKDVPGLPLIIHSLGSDAIVHLNPDGSLTPGLATSWRFIGKGRKQFEFTLRRNARFSDGTRVTAQAVKTWFEYFPKANGSRVPIMGPIASIATVGNWTVRLTLKTPNPLLPFVLSEAELWGFVASPKAVADPTILGTTTNGAGPYVLVPSQTVAGSQYTFAPNRFYYDKSKIKFSKVIVRIIANPSTMLQATRTGQLDVASGDATTAAAAQSSRVSVMYRPWGFDGLIFLDRGGVLEKALGDVRVRQALNYAIDRRAITRALMGKYATPTSEMMTTDGFDPKFQNFYPYNPAKARALLAAAGYARGFTFKAVTQGWSGNLGDPTVQAIAQYLKAVGVNLDITTGATFGDWFRHVSSGTFSAFQTPYNSIPMQLAYTVLLKPNVIGNQHGFSDPVINKLWVKGIRTGQKRYWREMSQRATRRAYFLPVFKAPQVFFVSKDIGGVAFSEKSLAVPLPVEWFPK